MFMNQEVEDREKVVRHLWDLYTQRQAGSGRRSRTRLPRFWQEAFEAAYDPLSSDVPAVRNAAVSEIAKMSIRSINVVDPFPLQSKVRKKICACSLFVIMIVDMKLVSLYEG